MKTFYWLIVQLARAFFTAYSGAIEVHNRGKRLQEGGAIIAANHASFLDPPAVACAYDTEIWFLARKTLFKGFASWFFPRVNAFPIDREHADIQSMKGILRKLKSGKRVLMFPEGTRSENGELGEAKAGIGMLVAKSGVPVQPVRIFGAYESWPKGGKHNPHPIRVVIGDPVDFDPEDLRSKSRESYQRIADQLMASIEALSLDLDGGPQQ